MNITLSLTAFLFCSAVGTVVSAPIQRVSIVLLLIVAVVLTFVGKNLNTSLYTNLSIVCLAALLGFIRVALPFSLDTTSDTTPMQAVVGSRLDAVVEHPQSTIAAALLTGQRTDIPKQTKEEFRASGLAHLLAVSGYNVTLVANMLLALTKTWLGKRTQTVLVLAGITLFVLGTGASAAVVRAGIMGGLATYALQGGRPTRALRILLLAAVLMTLLNPRVLIFDVGFQLSIAATGSILVLGRPLLKLLGKIPEILGLRENLATSLAATIGTAPLLAYTFGLLPLLGVLSNVLAVPLVPLIMLFGSIAAGLVGTPLAGVFGWSVSVLVEILERIASLGAKIPQISTNSLASIVVLFVSTALFLLILGINRMGKRGTVKELLV